MDDTARIKALIRDLRDPKFVVREAASQRLVEVGSPAVTALRLASKSDSLEVRVRVQAILTSILQKRDSNFGSSEQAIIKQFKDAKTPGRVAMLKAQAQSRNTALFLRLLDIVAAEEANSADGDQAESPVETLITAETVSPLAQFISTSLSNRNWSDIEKILTHPSIIKYLPMLRVNQAQQAGRLDAYIEDLYQKFSQAHANQQTIPSRELISLIGLLRVQKDFQRAETAIAWLSDESLQQRLRIDMVFQQGDWQEILRRSKLEPAAPDFIAVNLLQEALLHHLNGDDAGVADVKQRLRKQLQAAKEANEAAGEETAPAKLLRTKLRIVGAITMDWPLMAEFLDPDDLVGNFDLLNAHNRTAEALELIEVGASFKERLAWMEAALKEVDEAKDKMKKISAARNSNDYNKLRRIIDQKTQLTKSVAGVMEQRGMDDEAQLYYQMIYSTDETPQGEGRNAILEQLLGLGRTDDYWQLVDSILRNPAQLKYMSRTWFGFTDMTRRSIVQQWASRIRGAIVDPVEQSKTLAAIVNSPWVNRDELDFDLDFEIARFRSRSELDASGSDQFLLSQVLELNGRDEAAAQMLKQAAMLKSSGAILQSYQKALFANDNREILKYWIYNRAAGACLVAERAALKLLETETDPEEIKYINRQLKICRLRIAAQWIGGNTWDRGDFNEFQDDDESYLSIFRMQCIVYGVPGDFLNKERMHEQLGDAMSSEKANQASQGSIELATVMFDNLGYASGAVPDFMWSYSSTKFNLALARGMIQRGEHEKAANLLLRHVQFWPGDVSVGETTVKKLEEAGATEQADRVYQAVEKYFVETLEMYPESPVNRNNFAWLSATSQRDLEKARRHAKIAVKLRPDVEQYLDTLAEIEFLLGQPEAAFELSKRCVQLNPGRTYYRQQKERFRQAMSAAE